jgi:polysaccharide transporter, PST family
MNWLSPLSDDASTRPSGIRALLTMGGSQAAKLVLNIAATLILVRLLSPEDFGRYAMAALVINFIVAFKDLGLSTATIQASTLNQKQTSTLFWLNQAGGATMALLTLVCAPLLSRLFAEPALTPVIMVVSVGFVLGSLSAQHDALLRRNLKFAVIGGLEVAATLAGLVTAIVMARGGFGWYSLIAQKLVQIGCTPLFSWLVCNWRPSLSFDWNEARSDFKFGMHVMVSQLSGYVSQNADNLLIGWYWGAKPLGLYSKSYDLLTGPIGQIANPIGQVLQPILGRLRDKPDSYRVLARHALTGSLLALMPAGTLMFWQPLPVTQLLLGDQWLAAAPTLGWLGLGVATLLANSILFWLLITQRMGKVLTRTTLINTTVNLLGFAISLPFGITAIAATFVLLAIFFRTLHTAHAVTTGGIVKWADITMGLAQPAICFGTLTTLYLALPLTGLTTRLSSWQYLVVSLAMGYLLTALLTLPTPFGRYVLQLLQGLSKT